MPCPRCAAPMRAEVLAGHHGQSITIDICLPCQAMWFDGLESVRLAPASTLKLFRLIGENVEATPYDQTAPAPCPRCGAALRVAHDIQRNTRFEYRKCPAGDGRFITFYNFLREKQFIRPITPERLAELRAHVASVHCSNCGGPIDLSSQASCPHCRSPLTLLDLDQAGRLVDQLQSADRTGQPVDPALPLALERARREGQAAFDAIERDAVWFRDASRAGLVGAGVLALARWLKERV